jgi:hypothetical protein
MVLRRNVLIFHQGALGDFILTWPVALALGRLYPQSRIIYITHAAHGALAQRMLGVEWRDANIGGWHAMYAPAAHAALPEPSAALLRSAHTVISFIAAARGSDWLDNAAQLSGHAATIVALAPPLAAHQHTGHATDNLVRQLDAQPVLQCAVAQIVNWIRKHGITVRAAPAYGVVIHPGSGSPTKCWPLDRFIELARSLPSQNLPVTFLIGHVECERWSADDLRRLNDAFPPNAASGLRYPEFQLKGMGI